MTEQPTTAKALQESIQSHTYSSNLTLYAQVFALSQMLELDSHESVNSPELGVTAPNVGITDPVDLAQIQETLTNHNKTISELTHVRHTQLCTRIREGARPEEVAGLLEETDREFYSVYAETVRELFERKPLKSSTLLEISDFFQRISAGSTGGQRIDYYGLLHARPKLVLQSIRQNCRSSNFGTTKEQSKGVPIGERISMVKVPT